MPAHHTLFIIYWPSRPTVGQGFCGSVAVNSFVGGFRPNQKPMFWVVMGQDVHRAQAADDPSLIVQVEIGRTESGQSSACRANFPSLQSWEIITALCDLLDHDSLAAGCQHEQFPHGPSRLGGWVPLYTGRYACVKHTTIVLRFKPPKQLWIAFCLASISAPHWLALVCKVLVTSQAPGPL